MASVAAIQSQYESTTNTSSLFSWRTNGGLNLSSGGLEKRFNRGYETIIVGIAKNSPSATRAFIQLFDSNGGAQLTLREDGTEYKIYRGTWDTGTLLATSPAVTVGIGVYIELLVTVHPTAGAYELRINEVTQFSATNVNTQNTGTRDVGRVLLWGRWTDGSAGNCYIDDFYIADTAAPAPLGYFLGNQKIEALIPNAAGDVTGWTAFSDSNYRNVDDRPHNSDVDYNYSSTVNASDLYHLSNLSNSGSIRGVHVKYVARKDDALVRAVRPLIRTGGVTYAGGNDSLTTSYDEYFEVWTQNPQTLSDWSVADINALQVGIQTTS